jgi:hypothetical protein
MFYLRDRTSQTNPQTTQAWLAILGLVFLLAFGLLVGAGRFLILIFPGASLAIGVFLYHRYPTFYIGFTWWMWFVGSFVRRLIDYQSGYVTPGPWNLTPMLVTAISGLTLARYLPRFLNQAGLPFFLCIGSVIYGFLVGVIQNPISDAIIIPFLGWLTPICFGFHLFVHWRDYPENRQTFERIFVWGVLVMGVYGIYQYFVAPEWDRFWLMEVENPTYGRPEPLQIRVWSTVVIPQKFAALMMAGLMLLFVNSGILRFAAAGVGYLTFLLSRIRTAWLSLLLGLLILIPSLKTRLQIRFIVSVMVAMLIILPLSSIEPFSTVITSRLESFSNIQDDESYQARLQGQRELFDSALAEFVGRGLGAKLESDTSDLASYDNGILVLLFSLGWFGALPYLAGIVLLFISLFRVAENRSDAFASAARAIAISTFFGQIAFNPVMEGEFAMPLWGFLGMSLAAQQYYRRKEDEEKDVVKKRRKDAET